MKDLGLHPLIHDWFQDRFPGPTEAQLRAWRAIAQGRHTLVAAPTGSGKTLAAFLWSLHELASLHDEGALEDEAAVLYVSPLKALGNDIRKNLELPLREIRDLAERRGTAVPEVRLAVRSGDTPGGERQAQVRRPPHVWITTPESLAILLTADKGREALRTVRTVIVDEIHALAPDKRGSHLALTLERLDRLTGRPAQRIGLSATQKPLDLVARFLVGAGDREAPPDCAIVDAGHRRDLELRVEITDDELGPIASQELSARVYDRIVELVEETRTTLVFVNTRRLVERVSHALGERLGHDRVAAHHGSLSKESRLAAEEGLKEGRVAVVVATASLELGIDVGHVDRVVHLGAPRAIATLLQRVGRAGHSRGAVSRGVLFPLTRDELLQSAAAVRAVFAGELDRLEIPRAPLDILAQQLVAWIASEELSVDEAYALVRRAYPYRDLERKTFDEVVEMLAEGIATRRGRRSAWLHLDRVHGRLRARKGARLAALTSGGAIPDTADLEVVEEPTGALIGKVNEDFAIESMAGDIFLLGNHAWRIRRVEAGKVRVVDADGSPPTIPFWMGESPGRTIELSEAVSDLRLEIAERRHDPGAAARWLENEAGLDPAGARQLVDYVSEGIHALGAVPTTTTLVAERFFDEGGGMQLVIHAPFGARVNRAFGLALRKRFCVSFDFELQAAATDDGVVLSLGEQHSFPLSSVFEMIPPRSLEKDLVQAVLPSPIFETRWRWNAGRALAVLRHSGGKKVPAPLQRMRADDLLAAVFPAQAGCQDNRTGPIEPVRHPLVDQTLADCLHEAMDLERFAGILDRIRSGDIRTLAVESATPSVFSHELLNANPYAFLDDAPLEERRARAVSLRRTDADLAAGLGALDPGAIDEVRREAWPDPEDAESLHDALIDLVWVPARSTPPAWTAHLEELRSSGRVIRWSTPEDAWSTTDRVAWVRSALPEARTGDGIRKARVPARPPDSADEAAQVLVRGWMDAVGPTSVSALAGRAGLSEARVTAALARLEADGDVLRGSFEGSGEEWCQRGLLARIHRRTVSRLRSEIAAVEPATFLRFLLEWHHAVPRSRLSGRAGLREVIRALEGFEAPAPAWESQIFPSRIAGWDPADLDALCLSGEVVWARLSPRPPVEEADPPRRRALPTRSTPLSFILREDLAALRAGTLPREERVGGLTPAAREILEVLDHDGAMFLRDLAERAGRLPSEAEDALWELVAAGLVTGDGLAGLRALLTPEERRRPRLRPERARLRAVRGGRERRWIPAGRWSVLAEARAEAKEPGDAVAESVRRLLRRWGVLFREVVVRERNLPPWREVLRCCRRLEARGEIRGGRFVSGFVGEQFALPEAVDALRATRRAEPDGEAHLIAAADPLNLSGILVPGDRVSPGAPVVIAIRDGRVVEIGDLGTVRSRLRASNF